MGDGGPAITKITKSRWTTGAPPEDGSPLKSVEMTNDEELPAYSQEDSDPSGMSQHFSRNMSEGFDIDGPVYGPQPPWQDNAGWSFGNISGAAPAPSPDLEADEDLFQDSASTKVEDGDIDSDRGSPLGSWPASDHGGEIEPDVHELMDMSGGGGRGMRESAPPPDGMDVDTVKEQPILVVPPTAMDDDEDELPVAELHA